MMTLAMLPVSAAPGSTMKAPTIVNALKAPGASFNVDILLNETLGVVSYTFELYYDTSVLTATSISFTRPTFTTGLPSGIDDTIGKVWMGASRATGKDFGDWEPIATIIFSIDARGISALDLQNAVVTDKDANTITPTLIDGLFDNRYQGALSVDTIIDPTLVPTPEGTFVYVAIWVDDVKALWGFQGVLDFDPAILRATGFFMKHNGLTVTWQFVYDNTEGWVSIATSFPLAEKVGLTTITPKKVVTVEFEVIGLGITILDLHDTQLANIYGASLTHPVYDGGFVNLEMAPAIALDTLFVETRRFLLSKDDDGFQTLTAQIKNPIAEVGTTTARAHFIVYDSSLVPIKELYSDEVYISPSMTVRLPAKIKASGLQVPGAYIAEVTAQYLDATLAWTNGRKGSADGARSTMVKSFSVES